MAGNAAALAGLYHGWRLFFWKYGFSAAAIGAFRSMDGDWGLEKCVCAVGKAHNDPLARAQAVPRADDRVGFAHPAD